MKFLKRLLCFFKKLNPKLSTVVVYEWSGDTRTFYTSAMDAAARKTFLKHMFNTHEPKMIEVDGEPFGKFGKHVKPLKG